jgi:hypothetical protein
MRRRTLYTGAIPGLVLAVLVGGWTVVAFGAPPSAPPGPPVLVGTATDVQAWFRSQEAERVALNDALQAAYEQLGEGPTPGPGDGCSRLLQAADAMLATLPTPKRALNPLVVAGVGQFKAGAQQCLAGNASAARTSLAAAAEVRAEADLEVDEILEAPDASVD